MVSTVQVDATDVGEHAYLVLRESGRYRFFDKNFVSAIMMASWRTWSGLKVDGNEGL